ncbi:MAG: glycosyltransferase family 61 protein [Granulosicoccus sp.]
MNAQTDSVRLESQLAQSLSADAERYRQSGRLNDALACQLRAYALCPGQPRLLHDASQLYRELGDLDAAQLCRRGVLPESAEQRLFKAVPRFGTIVAAHRAAENRHHKVHSPEKTLLPQPERNACDSNRPEFRRKHTESRGTFVSELTNGRVWFDGFNLIVSDQRGRVLKEHVRGSVAVALGAANCRPVKALGELVCFLDARSSSIYYHWMIDVLPKLAVLESAGISLDDIDCFVVNCKFDFQRETLARFGIHEGRIHAPDTTMSMTAERMLIPYLKHDLGERLYYGLGLGIARWVPVWLRNTFTTSYRGSENTLTPTIRSPDSSGSNANEFLYISRAESGTRTLEKETALKAELELRGFRSVVLESHTVAEQAALLANASVVVAAHGAGLTNIAFCQPGTLVVEIFGEYVAPCYWSLAAVACLDYRQYLAYEALQSASGKTLSHPKTTKLSLAERRQLGIELDVEDFLSNLDRWLLPSNRSTAITVVGN